MFKFCNLYSGSSGNCSFIETENAKILVDVGVSCKKISDALSSLDVSISDIDAILLTHEHSDHIAGLPVITRKYGIPVFASRGTFDSIDADIPDDIKHFFVNNEVFDVNDLRVLPFSIPHDAADPCGFSVSYEGKKVSIATDIGHMESKIMDHLAGSSFLLLESNYEPDMLKCSSYPYDLKRRILGPNGHLSNEEAGDTVSTLLHYGVSKFALGHLSKNTNFPELAYQTVMDSVISSKIDDKNLSLSVADRDKPNGVVDIA